MSTSHTTQHDLSHEVDALTAALMGHAQPVDVACLVDRLEVIVSQVRDAPAAASTEVRSAIELVRGGQPCAAVSALLAARSELSVTRGADAS